MNERNVVPRPPCGLEKKSAGARNYVVIIHLIIGILMDRGGQEAYGRV